MAKMNYAKVNLQKRVQTESRDVVRPVFQSSGGFRWYEIRFGRHRSKTLPEVLRDDPEYFRSFLHAEDVLSKPLRRYSPTTTQIILAHQFEVIRKREQRILPDLHEPEKFEFVIVKDKNDVFRWFFIVAKGDRLKKVLPEGYGIKRVPKLNVFISLKYENSRLGLKRMARCL